ncbi:MAG TPA: sigma-54 dependent transcriptional regulator [Candidatus Acidoferrales bacterium]|nr:sigma-54 dependent transcriptional regulator [Candidatus Acidoferrales bacterium]
MNAAYRVVPFKEPLLTTRDIAASPSAMEELRLTRSPLMEELRQQVDRVAQVDVPVLLLGESGVGKEFVAHTLHARSPRSQATFLKVNCAALPSELLESELFGYEAGAFTGAVKAKPGQFELCDHGTILLDEIGEMSPALQAKLLHVLQDQQFSRLGGRRTITVDIRILAATNIDIHKALDEKIFRSDLYYRLNTITLHIPALRERREDIPLFLDYFMTQMSEQFRSPQRRFSKRVLDACLQYSWPGNIRELKNFVCRYLVLGDDEAAIAGLWDPEAESTKQVTSEPGLRQLVYSVRAEAERRVIEECLERLRWNRTETARALHISTKTLWNKMRQYGIRDSSRQREVPNDCAAPELPELVVEAPDSAGKRGKPLEPHSIGGVDAISPLKLANSRAGGSRALA